jgi:membrane protease YdiL (CAAX protease family)
MSKTHPAFNIIIIAAIAFGCLLVSQSVAVGIVAFLYELGFGELEGILSRPTKDIPNVREIYWIIQGLSLLVGLGGGAFLYQVIVAKTNFRDLNQTKDLKIVGLVLASAIFILSVPLSAEMMNWNSNIHFGSFDAKIRSLESQAAALTKILTNMQNPTDLLCVLVVIAVIPAFAEEYLFRGLLQNEFLRWFKNGHWAVLVTSIIFSAIHFQFLGFLPRVFLGMLLGYLYLWSGNLIYPMIGHFVNNGIQVLALYLHQQKIIASDINEHIDVPITVLLPFSALLAVGLFLFEKKFRPSTTQHIQT